MTNAQCNAAAESAAREVADEVRQVFTVSEEVWRLYYDIITRHFGAEAEGQPTPDPDAVPPRTSAEDDIEMMIAVLDEIASYSDPKNPTCIPIGTVDEMADLARSASDKYSERAAARKTVPPLAPAAIDVEELQRLWEASTQGDWFVGCKEFLQDGETVIAHMCGQDVIGKSPNAVSESCDSPDQHFIAAAHNHLPAILQELRTARQSLTRLLAVIKKHRFQATPQEIVSVAEEISAL